MVRVKVDAHVKFILKIFNQILCQVILETVDFCDSVNPANNKGLKFAVTTIFFFAF
jgi:hypothetical protein